MPARAVWRPRSWTWALLGLSALGLTHFAAPSRLEGHWLLITPVLIVIAVLVLRRLWEAPPAVTLSAAIVLTIFSGAWRQIGLGGLPLDRLLLVFVILQFALRAPGTASTPRLRVRNVHLVMCLAVMYLLASAVAAKTLTTEAGFLPLIDQFGVLPYIMFLLAPAAFSGERERNLLLASLVGLGAYLGTTAIFESLGPHSLVFPHYITQVDAEISSEGRAGGPFQAVIAEGFATFACAVAAAIAFAQWHGRQRYLAAAVGVICIVGCFLTLERGVWIAAIVAGVIAAMVTRRGRRYLAPAAMTCALVLGGALVASPAFGHKLSTRTSDQESVWDRQNQISAGLRMVAAKPLFGFGWSRYTADDLEYFRESPEYPMNGYTTPAYEAAGRALPLHETYLAYTVELGLVGALLWLVSLLGGIGLAITQRGPRSLRPWKLGLLTIAICFLVIGLFNPYQAPFPVLLLWVWAGVALGAPAMSAVRKAPAPLPLTP